MAHNHLLNCCPAKPINRWKKHWNWKVLPLGFKYKREPSPLTVYIINDLTARKINSKLPFDLGKVFGYGLLCYPQEHKDFVQDTFSTAINTVAEKQGVRKALGTYISTNSAQLNIGRSGVSFSFCTCICCQHTYLRSCTFKLQLKFNLSKLR